MEHVNQKVKEKLSPFIWQKRIIDIINLLSLFAPSNPPIAYNFLPSTATATPERKIKFFCHPEYNVKEMNGKQMLACVQAFFGDLSYCTSTNIRATLIDHFTVVGLVNWPLNGSEAGVDLVLIQTSLLLLCRSSFSYAN